MAGARSAGRMPFMSASPLNRRSAALYGAELTQPGYQQRIAESHKFPKEQTKKLISQSKALNDAKLRLGLGPVTDKALSDSVSVKGEENPDPNTANQEVEFSGPSVGLTPEDQLIVGRIIHYSDPEGMGFISKYERGTEAQLEQRQQDADMAGNAQES